MHLRRRRGHPGTEKTAAGLWVPRSDCRQGAIHPCVAIGCRPGKCRDYDVRIVQPITQLR